MDPLTIVITVVVAAACLAAGIFIGIQLRKKYAEKEIKSAED